jgi:hypothetical protein
MINTKNIHTSDTDTDTDTDTTDTENNQFDGGEFVLMQNADKEIVGGGYKINSFFLKEGKSPITTYNNPNQDGDNVSCQFDNFAVPAGLFLLRVNNPSNKNILTQEPYYQPHEMASDDLMDKLFALVEKNKIHKRKTRKHNTKSNKRKTRKYTNLSF